MEDKIFVVEVKTNTGRIFQISIKNIDSTVNYHSKYLKPGEIAEEVRIKHITQRMIP